MDDDMQGQCGGVFSSGVAALTENFIITENGDYLVTESGAFIVHGEAVMPNVAATHYFSVFAERTTGVTVTSDTFVPLVTLNVQEFLAGTYELALSSVVSSPDTNDSVYFQLTTTDGTQAEWSKEAKDVTDVIPFTFIDQVEYLGSTIDPPRNITLSIRKEDAGASDLYVVSCMIHLKRVSELFLLTGTGPTPP